MSPIIIRTSQAADRHGDPESVTRGHLLSGSRPAAGHSNSHRERGAYRASAICYGAVFPVRRTVCAINVRAGHTLPGSSSIHDTKSVRMNFSRPLRRPGSLLPFGDARFQACQQSSRCVANRFQVPISFRGALASQEQEITERIPDDAKTGARPRNLTAREGNYAC